MLQLGLGEWILSEIYDFSINLKTVTLTALGQNANSHDGAH